MTQELLSLADEWKISLTAQFLLRKYNGDADHRSQGRSPPVWHLLPEFIFNHFGYPDIDLFASATAHVILFHRLRVKRLQGLMRNLPKRIQSTLGLQPSLDISSAKPNPKGPSSFEQSSGNLPTSSFKVAKSILATRPDSPAASTSSQNIQPGNDTNR